MKYLATPSIVLIFLLMLSAIEMAQAQPDNTAAVDQDDARPVIIAISIGEEQYQSELGNFLYNKVVSLLSQQKRISFVDRSALESILQEQHLQLSGFANSYDIVRIGQLEVAQYVLDMKAGKLEKDISLSLALADTSTGETIYQKEICGAFKKLDLPVFILCDAIALKTTGKSIPPPDGVQLVTVTTSSLPEFKYKVFSNGKALDGIMYVQGNHLLVSGEKLSVQIWFKGECIFGFPVPDGLQTLEFELNELPKHRLEAMLRDINLNKLSPLQETALNNYGLYGLLIFDMWVYRDMNLGDIAMFMNLEKEVVELFSTEFNDTETRLFGK
ncbi:hypothetical protein J7K50_09495 [bacterium]|nr:hypothetical protein [bacterium]